MRLFCLLFFCGFLGYAQLEIYPAVSNEEASIDFNLNIENKSVFVHKTPVGSVAMFGGVGEMKVHLKTRHVIRYFRALPEGNISDLKFINDNEVSFTLLKHSKLSIEINGRIKNPLFLFYNPVEAKVFPTPNANDLVFEGGQRYKVGWLKLKPNQNLFIRGGAILEGAILADGANNTGIYGFGSIDGSKVRRLEDKKDKSFSSYKDEIRLVHFKNCKNVEVKGVSLLNSFAWNLVPQNSQNVLIDGVNIISGNPSDDGIDIVSSSNVLVKNCFVKTKDDCVAIKALTRASNESDFCKDIVVDSCTFWSSEWGNAMEIGYELQYPVIENITFKNIEVIRVEHGAVLSIHQTDDSVVRNVTLENITVQNAFDKFLDFGIFFSYFSHDNPYDRKTFVEHHYLQGPWDNAIDIGDNKEKHAKGRGSIENITIKNIAIKGYMPFSILAGYNDNHLVKNIDFDEYHL